MEASVGDVVDLNGNPIEITQETYPVDALITALQNMRKEITCALIVMRVDNLYDDWAETDNMLQDTKVALATYLLDETKRLPEIFLELDGDENEPA